MFFNTIPGVFLVAAALAASGSNPTPNRELITAAPVTTTSVSISFINTATVTCLYQVCMHEYSYCWYWPTMEVGIGSLGAEPSFTLAPFATCSEPRHYITSSTLETVTVSRASTTQTGGGNVDGYEEETPRLITSVDDCEGY